MPDTVLTNSNRSSWGGIDVDAISSAARKKRKGRRPIPLSEQAKMAREDLAESPMQAHAMCAACLQMYPMYFVKLVKSVRLGDDSINDYYCNVCVIDVEFPTEVQITS